MANGYHEQNLSQEVINTHRAIQSLIEELEATNWYNQRADVCPDEELKSILIHNRNEEIEHAAMLLEWLRRKITDFDEQLGTYLFTEKPILQVEEEAENEESNENASKQGSGDLGLKSGK